MDATTTNNAHSKGTQDARKTSVDASTKNAQTIRLFGTENDSIVDGLGLRFCVFVQGCNHKCKGCHNPGSWDANGGTLRTISDVLEEIHENALVRAVTLSGGEPFCQACACAKIALELKRDGYNVWCYTGYLFEEVRERADVDACVMELLENIDVLVDGPFVEELNSYELNWRGSSNQRIIDMPKTLAKGEVILWEEPKYIPKKPENW